jgi:hypothetical protein
MRLAFQEMLARREGNEKIRDLRTAAFSVAIEKIAQSYIDVSPF